MATLETEMVMAGELTSIFATWVEGNGFKTKHDTTMHGHYVDAFVHNDLLCHFKAYGANFEFEFSPHQLRKIFPRIIGNVYDPHSLDRVFQCFKELPGWLIEYNLLINNISEFVEQNNYKARLCTSNIFSKDITTSITVTRKFIDYCIPVAELTRLSDGSFSIDRKTIPSPRRFNNPAYASDFRFVFRELTDENKLALYNFLSACTWDRFKREMNGHNQCQNCGSKLALVCQCCGELSAEDEYDQE